MQPSTKTDLYHDTFISYSRTDKDSAHRFSEALKRQNLKVWLDIDDIPRGVEWWAEIRRGIVTSHAVLFLLSKKSLGSMVCNWELAYAIEQNKKIIVIELEDVGKDSDFLKQLPGLEWDNPQGKRIKAQANWEHIHKINYIFAHDFPAAVDQTITAVHTDYEYVQSHTKFTERANNWEGKHRSRRYVLRGGDLEEALSWRAGNEGKEPPPSDLLNEYISVSQRTVARQRNARIGITFFAVLMMGVLVRLYQSQQTETQKEAEERVSAQQTAEAEGIRKTSLALIAEANNILEDEYGNVETATLLALRGLHLFESTQAHDTLVRTVPHLSTEIYISGLKFSFEDTSIIRTRQLAISSQDTWLAIGSTKEVTLWSTATGQPIKSFATDASIASVEFSPDDRHLLVGLESGVAIIDIDTGQEIAHFDYRGPLVSATFSPDGRLVLSASTNGYAQIWDVQQATLVNEYDNQVRLIDARFLPNGSSFVAIGMGLADGAQSSSSSLSQIDGIINIWALDTGTMTSIDPDLVLVTGMDVSPDGARVAVSGDNQLVQIIDLATGTLLRELDTDVASLQLPIRFSPDGNLLLTLHGEFTTSAPNVAQLWNTDTGQRLKIFTGHTGMLLSGTFTHSGDRIATVAADNTARIWRIHNPIGEISIGHNQYALGVYQVDVAPNGQYVASSGFYNLDNPAAAPNYVTIQSTQNGEVLHRLEDPTSGILGVTFSPDSSSLLTFGAQDFASNSSFIRLWQVSTGAEQFHLNTQTNNFLHKVEFSPSGNYLVMAEGEAISNEFFARTPLSYISIWDAHNGDFLYSLTSADTNTYRSLTLFPSTDQMILVTSTNRLLIWNIATQQVVYELAIPEGQIIEDSNISPNGELAAILTYAYDSAEQKTLYTASVWNLITGENLYTFPSLDHVPDLGVSNTGVYVLGEAETGTQLSWWGVDGPTTLDIALLVPNETPQTEQPLFVTDDGQYLVTFETTLGNAQVWNPATGEHIRTLEVGASAAPSAIEFFFQRFIDTNSLRKYIHSQDGRYILFGDTLSGVVRLWDIETGNEVQVFSSETVLRGPTLARYSEDEGFLITTTLNISAVNTEDIEASGQIIQAKLWALDYASIACQHLVRDLTVEERTLYGIQDSTPTCLTQSVSQASSLNSVASVTATATATPTSQVTPSLAPSREQLPTATWFPAMEVVFAPLDMKAGDGRLVQSESFRDIELGPAQNRLQKSIFGAGFMTEGPHYGDIMIGASITGQDYCGFVLRQYDENNLYVIIFNPDGTLEFDARIQGAWQAPQTKSITPLDATANDLVVLAVDDLFAVFINGELATYFQDEEVEAGEVGLAGLNTEGQSDVQCSFTDAWVWELNPAITSVVYEKIIQ